MQKLYCPKCGKLLIKNTDLVIDNPIVMDLDRIKSTDKEVKTITCHNCKRRLRYYIEEKDVWFFSLFSSLYIFSLWGQTNAPYKTNEYGNCKVVSKDKCKVLQLKWSVFCTFLFFKGAGVKCLLKKLQLILNIKALSV